jgi:hypothetical protein
LPGQSNVATVYVIAGETCTTVSTASNVVGTGTDSTYQTDDDIAPDVPKVEDCPDEPRPWTLPPDNWPARGPAVAPVIARPVRRIGRKPRQNRRRDDRPP